MGSGLLIVFIGAAFSSLQTPVRDYLFPYAPELQIALQVGIFVLLVPFLRIRLCNANFWLLIGFYTLFLLALASALWSSYPYLVFRRSLIVFITPLVICGLTLSDSKPIVTFNQLAHCLALFGTVMSLVGLIGYFFGRIDSLDSDYVSSLNLNFLSISQRLYGNPPLFRISSLLGNPNDLALWLLVTLTMTIYLRTKGSHKREWGMLALIQGIALIFTFSRTGILATVVCIILFWCFSSGIMHLRKLMLLLLGFTAICMTLAFQLFLSQGQNIRLSLDLNLRQLAWGPLFASILNNPLLGVGFGVSYEAILKNAGIDFNAHNAFLGILSEIGLLGLLVFIVVWLIPMWHIRKWLKFASKPSKLVLSTCLAISIALALNQLFEFQILRYSFYNLLWTYLMVLMVHPALIMVDTDD
jgi:O-antigen ligase